MISLLAASAGLSSELVSLHDFALVPLPLCLPILSPFMISLLAGSLLQSTFQLRTTQGWKRFAEKRFCDGV